MVNDNNKYKMHHVRPRFKNDVEGVLLFMANKICDLGEKNMKQFDKELNNIIFTYPDNSSKTKKTINNWRTEISALFGLFQYDGDKKKPSELCKMLATNQDLIQFFRYFLYYFQYPGGHLKSEEACKMIKEGIRFHPVKYLLQVFLEGTKITGKKFGITKAEAAHVIFNDLEVTRDERSPKKTVELIIENRIDDNHRYDKTGDIVRYAGDILDYMELADLIERKPNFQYYPKMQYIDIFQAYIKANVFFPEYKNFYFRDDIKSSDITKVQNEWFDFINSKLDDSLFKTDVSKFILPEEEDQGDENILELFLRNAINNSSVNTREIGGIGEAIVLNHEKIRIGNLNQKELVHLIKKIPDHFGVGYDIKSFLGEDDDFTNIHIEVKSTISKGKISIHNFHMTQNEWRAAESYQDLYFIYRVMISSEDVKMFVIRNPVAKYKKDIIKVTPRGGASIIYNESSGQFVDVLS